MCSTILTGLFGKKSKNYKKAIETVGVFVIILQIIRVIVMNFEIFTLKHSRNSIENKTYVMPYIEEEFCRHQKNYQKNLTVLNAAIKNISLTEFHEIGENKNKSEHTQEIILSIKSVFSLYSTRKTMTFLIISNLLGLISIFLDSLLIWSVNKKRLYGIQRMFLSTIVIFLISSIGFVVSFSIYIITPVELNSKKYNYLELYCGEYSEDSPEIYNPHYILTISFLIDIIRAYPQLLIINRFVKLEKLHLPHHASHSSLATLYVKHP